jgi:pyridoxamine 5'-phosphate oxidase
VANIMPDHDARVPLMEHQAGPDPMALFQRWLSEAEGARLPEPNAMALSTIEDDVLSCRIVLLRGLDEGGFVFFTNYNSRKAMQLERDARAALTFHWPQMERQVRIEGRAERISAERSDAYFSGRPRGSQIGAWASDQSSAIRDRATLDAKYARWVERFTGQQVPRPAHWGGFRVVPVRIEFWQGRTDRMHDRLRYERGPNGAWSRDRLQP